MNTYYEQNKTSYRDIIVVNTLMKKNVTCNTSCLHYDQNYAFL